MIRLAISTLALGLMATAASAQNYQYYPGYTRQNGTYVQPHYQTAPDGNPYNNWSTRGNTNPFTGQPGTRHPSSDGTLPYRGW